MHCAPTPQPSDSRHRTREDTRAKPTRSHNTTHVQLASFFTRGPHCRPTAGYTGCFSPVYVHLTVWWSSARSGSPSFVTARRLSTHLPASVLRLGAQPRALGQATWRRGERRVAPDRLAVGAHARALLLVRLPRERRLRPRRRRRARRFRHGAGLGGQGRRRGCGASKASRSCWQGGYCFPSPFLTRLDILLMTSGY